MNLSLQRLIRCLPRDVMVSSTECVAAFHGMISFHFKDEMHAAKGCIGAIQRYKWCIPTDYFVSPKVELVLSQG